MKFKQGDAVEVLRRGKDHCDSWFPGKITSTDEYKYTVRFNREEDTIEEVVYKENVRPPPPPTADGRLALGDIIEVFYLHSWKVGKVAKVLNYHQYVIKFFDSIQLKIFQRSDIRVRLAWQTNEWVMLKGETRSGSSCKTMTFKQGDAVEVLRGEKEYCSSWFPGKLISADEYKYTVRFNREEKVVCKENVRPPPPPMKGERLVLGDMIEVFYLHSWKVGKVAKVLDSNQFVIKVFGSIQLKIFQRSDLRVLQDWQNNKWVVLKVGGNKQIDNAGNASNHCQGWSYVTPERHIHKEAGTQENWRPEHLEAFLPGRTLKRKHECSYDFSFIDGAKAGRVKEKEITRDGQCGMLPVRPPAVPKQVAVVSSHEKKTGKKCMIRSKMDVKNTNNYFLHPFPMPAHVTKAGSECSVASCSGNDYPEYHVRLSQKSSWDTPSNSFNDAESLCVTESRRKHLPSYPEVELGADIHKLELRAYKLTMQALYASGPLSWEQESLLTNLRLSLHISNEEHLLRLKDLLSSQVL